MLPVMTFARNNWLVLFTDHVNGQALLLSESSIGCDSFNDIPTSAKWRSSSIRKWLNSDFLEIYFSKEERETILPVVLENKNNPETESIGGTKTKDRVFLLSLEEVEKFLSDERDQNLYENQFYLDKQGNVSVDEQDYKRLTWWLRSPGMTDYSDNYASVVVVDSFYGIDHNGINVISEAEIRPAVWIDLKSSIFNNTVNNGFGDCLIDGAVDFSKTSINGNTVKKLSDTKKSHPGNKKTILFAGLEWDVLGENTVYNRALMITADVVGHKCYGEGPSTWETSVIRSWLNNEFLSSNFNKTEQEKILSVEVDNNDNPMYKTEGGNKTIDKVFLLSFDEVNRYYESVQERAIGEGWWLRSPGRDSGKAACVYAHGVSAYYGFDCSFELAVRPAMFVDMSVINSL